MTVAKWPDEAVKVLNGALDAMESSQVQSPSASPGRCSDAVLAKRLRNKRLGIQPPQLFEVRKTLLTLRSIAQLINRPWTQLEHPWHKLQPEAPRLHATMGAGVVDLLRDQIVLRERAYMIDGLVYEPAPKAQNDRAWGEVCFFIDGRLALAWDVQMHRLVIERWHEMKSKKRSDAECVVLVSEALRACLRQHPASCCEWLVSQVSPAGRARVQSHVKYAAPATVWGDVRPNTKSDSDELVLVAALNIQHLFYAYV